MLPLGMLADNLQRAFRHNTSYEKVVATTYINVYRPEILQHCFNFKIKDHYMRSLLINPSLAPTEVKEKVVSSDLSSG